MSYPRPDTYPVKVESWSTPPWNVAGVVGASNTGSVRFGVKSVGLRWYWEIGLELQARPEGSWTDLANRTNWVLASGYASKTRNKDEVVQEVSSGAGFWLAVLQAWTQQRYQLIDLDFDYSSRRHDCGWCMGHPETNARKTVTSGPQ